METLLVPTDFSPTAKNAALYALQLAEQLAAKKIVLYHSYEIPVTIDPMVPGIQMLDMESLKEDSEKGLEIFKQELLALASGINIDTISEYGALTQGLDDVCSKVNAGLVVMGITGGGVLEEKLIGSYTLSVAKHTKLPVIIVPANARFTRIEEIMLTSDFDKADKAIPVDLVRKILAETKAKLFVFNIEEDEVIEKYPSTIMGESYAIHSLLQDMNPEYHYSTNTNYVEAVNDFALEYQIDLIISIPKKHGFFERLFTTSHTKQLAFHSHVPLMVIHQ
jgi:nucleotide-binding universal stress UspA family protein